MVCHGHFLLYHGQTCRNCHGHFSFFTGIFLAILSRATGQFSRAKFSVFCHGHFTQILGSFFIKCHGQTENCLGKKNTALDHVLYFRFLPQSGDNNITLLTWQSYIIFWRSSDGLIWIELRLSISYNKKIDITGGLYEIALKRTP